MMIARRNLKRRPPAGVVSIELLLLMPFFALLLFSVYMLGDIMFVQEKTELAARYVAWKQRPIDGNAVRSVFFSGMGSRKQVQSFDVTQGLSDRRYPKTSGDESTQAGALGAPPRFLRTPLSGMPHPDETLRVGYVSFEGNTSGGNKAAHSSYFGVDQSMGSGGGGWVMEQWGTVVTHYRPMGYTSLNLKLASAHRVLLGKDYASEIGSGGWGGSSFRFRQAAVASPAKTGIAAKHDEVNGTSWENSGLIKELYPQP